MAAPLDDVCCARLPADALALLGALRVHPGLRVRLVGPRVWLYWTPGDDRVLPHVLPLHGAEVFALRDGLWYRPGGHLPAFEVPAEEDTQPLAHVLTPAPVCPECSENPAFGGFRSRSERTTLACLPLGLVRDEGPRPATALCCPLTELARWAEQATSRQLSSLEGLRRGDRVLLRGARLPMLAGGERYWGRTILVPLGLRPEPDLSEGVLREALGLQPEEIALLTPSGAEVVPAGLFRPLTRAAVRLAVRERAR